MPTSTKNYYRILQVDPSAEQEVIEAAYKRLVLKYHPDRNSSINATALMQDINEAYDTLHDPVKRAEYDNRRRTYIERQRAEKTEAGQRRQEQWFDRSMEEKRRQAEEQQQKHGSNPQNIKCSKCGRSDKMCLVSYIYFGVASDFIDNPLTELIRPMPSPSFMSLALWSKLYYCQRDDGIFDPRKNLFVPTSQVMDYLHLK